MWTNLVRSLAGMAAVVAFANGDAAAAQGGAPATSWEIRSSPAADLWFHGLALVGFDGPGPLAYYSDVYARAARAEKRALGIPPTRLARDAQELRTAFTQHAGFETLHLLPLYSREDDPGRLLASVRAVATRHDASAIHDGRAPRQAAAMSAIGRVLATPTERAALRQFADALADEWDVFLNGSRARQASAETERLVALQRIWQRDFVPVIAPYIRTLAVRRGVLHLSRALGPEGRIVHGDDMVVVAVGWPATGAPQHAPLLAVVRELCFPLVERVTLAPPAMTNASRLAAIDANSRAAVRCGAMLLEAGELALPAGTRHSASGVASLSQDYRRLFLDWPDDVSDGDLERRFQARFALEPAVEQSLRVEVAHVMSGARAMLR